ncbi:MAG: P1 family peptidase, partial [Bacillota bacterium]|nr:P1 family peptidase [Bacillota bacterium]
LGVLETPIALTNTFGVAAALEGLLDYVLAQNPDIGVTTGTVNAVVGECNDAFLNDIRGRHLNRSHVLDAISCAQSDVSEGDVGAGKGMVCFGYKGGIGTASRQISGFTVGCLVLTNFGSKENLTIAGAPVGVELWRKEQQQAEAGDGSVIIILATDAPLDSRQLGRLARRGGFGLARTGSVASHGSGDFVIAFSTTNRKPHDPQTLSYHGLLVHENSELFTGLFQAVTESVEEAVVNALFAARTVVGRDGNVAQALPVNEVLAMLKWRD